MIEGKKISELGLVTSINDGCCFPLLSNGATKRITFAVLLENIIDNLVLPENQQIKELKEKISNIDTSIELTDQQVEKIKKQIEEIQKDVDSQDEIIVKYLKLFEELKEAYDRVEVAGGIIDDELDETSEHAVQNKVIAKLIPEQASEENKLADKDFVNSSIATNTADFVDTFNSLEELLNVNGHDNNDYAFVKSTDEHGNTLYNRYKWDGSKWKFEYSLNNSSFTSEQWKAINSDVTEEWKNETDEKLNQVAEKIEARDFFLSKDFSQGGNEKVFSFKVNRQYFSKYYEKKTFLLSSNVYSEGFSKALIGLLEVSLSTADSYTSYVVNLAGNCYKSVIATNDGEYVKIDVTFSTYLESGCVLSCNSLSGVPIKL